MGYLSDFAGIVKDTAGMDFHNQRDMVSGFWENLRDPLETLTVLAGNYYYPGSSLITSQLVSKGSQEQLSSPLGTLAQLGTGGAGAYAGNFSNYGALGNWITGGSADFSNFGFNTNPSGLGIGYGTDTFAGDSGKLGDFFDNLRKPKNIFGLAGGIYNIYQAQKLKELAQQQGQLAAPWDTSGGRGLAIAQLQALMNDPAQAAQNDPAYQLRLQAAQRGASKYGTGSGAMAVQAANASTDWLNNRLAQLAALAGTGFDPANRGEIVLRGTEAANTLRNQGISDFAGVLADIFG